MTETVNKIIINSLDRDIIQFPSSSSFRIDFPHAFKDVSKIRLRTANIFTGVNQIDENNNVVINSNNTSGDIYTPSFIMNKEGTEFNHNLSTFLESIDGITSVVAHSGERNISFNLENDITLYPNSSTLFPYIGIPMNYGDIKMSEHTNGFTTSVINLTQKFSGNGIFIKVRDDTGTELGNYINPKRIVNSITSDSFNYERYFTNIPPENDYFESNYLYKNCDSLDAEHVYDPPKSVLNSLQVDLFQKYLNGTMKHIDFSTQPVSFVFDIHSKPPREVEKNHYALELFQRENSYETSDSE